MTFRHALRVLSLRIVKSGFLPVEGGREVVGGAVVVTDVAGDAMLLFDDDAPAVVARAGEALPPCEAEAGVGDFGAGVGVEPELEAGPDPEADAAGADAELLLVSLLLDADVDFFLARSSSTTTFHPCTKDFAWLATWALELVRSLPTIWPILVDCM